MSNFPGRWRGPSGSPEYLPLMSGIVVICGLALLSSLFPIVGYIIGTIMAAIIVISVIKFGLYIRRERKLDWEAMYGPTTEEEKDTANDKQ